jgi:hypothetical protein
MSDIEVYLDWQGECRPVGLLRRQPGRGRETVSFVYDDHWINARDSFSIDASLVSALKSAPISAQYPAVHSRAIAPQFPLTYPLRQCG